MKIKSQKDFFAGLMFAVVGGAFAWGASTYNVGNGARMGPGYFPLMLGILMSLIGLAIMFTSMTAETEDGEPIGKWAWKQIVFIISANLAFGLLLGGLPSIGIPAMGLIIGIYALVLISSLAGSEFDLKKVLILATVLAVGSYIAFIWALKLQLQVWPTFITG
ncbi:tripartite tricarboxylate transporter TctB family protein [Variovorax sp. J22G21]|uniref:tripartite tricarboxylate transporter TctB family protein n=1 Tax=Variovorax fucosicus TaxID=3053517 RepID=UPI0025781CF5|nr:MULTISPECIES: tripartite tricarboxylate transporter TctB family protein [unclassified Variovorax]MDM0040063.1 tripartite tricarboxylate transporter TctB family protein [Variovorax sp. J22R193]MDM0054115.1 tripartite tricarboxylate transporter TctB family protein [Variovorax sp. J22G47]MDM0061436.1 tripartite tricarboxylate transporter TctB family protein [Variovorax sp. J22G21]